MKGILILNYRPLTVFCCIFKSFCGIISCVNVYFSVYDFVGDMAFVYVCVRKVIFLDLGKFS